MRTSASQFQLLVDFMERHGDLSKPTDGPQGRIANINRWAELTEMLNADATGDTKTSEKWRKVWSDFKNNVKKKAARINRAASGTGGGPASKLQLSDLEAKTLSIIGTRAATGIVEIPEVGMDEDDQPPSVIAELLLSQPQVEVDVDQNTQDWNQPGSSSQPAFFPLLEVSEGAPVAGASGRVLTPPVASGSGVVRPASVQPTDGTRRGQSSQSPTPLPATPRRRRRLLPDNITSPVRRRTRTQTQSELARQAFVRSDHEWRIFQQESERERIRLREVELRQQERWLDLFSEAIRLGNRYLDILDRN